MRLINQSILRNLAIFLLVIQSVIAFIGIISVLYMWPMPLYFSLYHKSSIVYFFINPIIAAALIKKNNFYAAVSLTIFSLLFFFLT